MCAKNPTGYLNLISRFVVIQCMNHSFICFPCLNKDYAQSPEEVLHVNLSKDLVAEFCVEEYSYGVNFKPASLTSIKDVQLTLSYITGKGGTSPSLLGLKMISCCGGMGSDGKLGMELMKSIMARWI